MHDDDSPDDAPPPDDSELLQTAQRAEQVQAWAQRMKDKRAARQAQAQPKADDATYWSTDALFAESRHVEESEMLTGDSESHRVELLASLGLGPTASTNDVTRAFRELAKLHHPDRYVDASAEVQAHHSDAMTRINNAYQALKLFAVED